MAIKKKKQKRTEKQKAASRRNLIIAREYKKRMAGINPFLNKWHGAEGFLNRSYVRRDAIKYLKKKKLI